MRVDTFGRTVPSSMRALQNKRLQLDVCGRQNSAKTMKCACNDGTVVQGGDVSVNTSDVCVELTTREGEPNAQTANRASARTQPMAIKL